MRTIFGYTVYLRAFRNGQCKLNETYVTTHIYNPVCARVVKIDGSFEQARDPYSPQSAVDDVSHQVPDVQEQRHLNQHRASQPSSTPKKVHL